MTVKSIRQMVDAIEKAGIKKFTIWCNNSYIIDVNGESTKVIFDDANERLFYLRIPNGVGPGNNMPLAVECEEYELVERICAAGDQKTILGIFNDLGLKPTEDITQWLKTAGSQSGLYPVQSTPTVDVDGKPVYNLPYRPTITTS